jgi:transcriptional regulator GlxA family with amidase domain
VLLAERPRAIAASMLHAPAPATARYRNRKRKGHCRLPGAQGHACRPVHSSRAAACCRAIPGTGSRRSPRSAPDFETEALHPDLAAVIKNAAAKGKIIAAQNGGVTMLAKAGVLSGKKYAAVNVATMDFKDGIYSGSGVVGDGTIITSGICPGMGSLFNGMQDGTPRLMELLLAALKQTT